VNASGREARRPVIVLIALLVAFVGPGAAAATELLAGDVIVADPDKQGLFALDLMGGGDVAIPTTGPLLYPTGVAADGAARLFVADPDANALWSIDPESGDQEIVCSGAPMLYPSGVAVRTDGHLLVADPVANVVFDVDPFTCNVQVSISGAPLLYPTGVRIDPDGDVLVADPDANAIFRFAEGEAPASVTEADLLQGASGVSTDLADLLIVDPVALQVVRWSAGTQALETQPTGLLHPTDLDVVPVPEPGWPAIWTAGTLAIAVGARWRARRDGRS